MGEIAAVSRIGAATLEEVPTDCNLGWVMPIHAREATTAGT